MSNFIVDPYRHAGGCFWEADFSSSSGWTELDATYMSINTSSERLDWDSQVDGTIDNIYYTLDEALSEDAWNLRWVIHITTLTQANPVDTILMMGLARQGTGGGNCYNGCVDGDSGIGACIAWNVSATKNRGQLFSTGASADIGTQTLSASTTYYFELIYDNTGTTTTTFKIRETNFDATPLETLEVEGTALSEIDTFAVRNRDLNFPHSTFIGYISSIQINNGSVDPC